MTSARVVVTLLTCSKVKQNKCQLRNRISTSLHCLDTVLCICVVSSCCENCPSLMILGKDLKLISPCTSHGITAAAFGVTRNTGDAKERCPQVGARAPQDLGVRAQLGIIQTSAFGDGPGGRLVREGHICRRRPRFPPRTRTPPILVRNFLHKAWK